MNTQCERHILRVLDRNYISALELKSKMIKERNYKYSVSRVRTSLNTLEKEGLIKSKYIEVHDRRKRLTKYYKKIKEPTP